jgi:hypothetical protein
VIVILCRQFIEEAEEEINRTILLHLLPLRTVIFILYGGIKSIRELASLQLASSILASMQHDGRTIVWPCSETIRARQTSKYERLVSTNSVSDETATITRGPAQPYCDSSHGGEGEQERNDMTTSADEEMLLKMDDDFWRNVESHHKGAVNKFWVLLRLAIPNKNMHSDSEVPTVPSA